MLRLSVRSLEIAVFAFVVLFSSARAETLRIRADSWMPYNGDPADELPGYAIEIARLIFEAEGINVDYQNMPWGDALKAVAAGGIDAVLGANKDEADGLVIPAEPIGLPRVALFVAKDNPWRYENLASLYQVKLGVVLDYAYWSTLDAYIERSDEPRVFKLTGEQPLHDALRRLQRGDLDVVAETTNVFAWNIKHLGIEPGTFRPAYLHEGDPVYFAFSPHHPKAAHYAAILDAGLRELRRSGKLAPLLARYGQTDWASQR